jgi:hypothetical protein
VTTRYFPSRSDAQFQHGQSAANGDLRNAVRRPLSNERPAAKRAFARLYVVVSGGYARVVSVAKGKVGFHGCDSPHTVQHASGTA